MIAHAILERNYGVAFLWMLIGVGIDATDGPLARHFQIKLLLPQIDGRRLDDLIDYLNYTFLPILLIGHAGWLPDPLWLWMTVPLVASALAFANAILVGSLLWTITFIPLLRALWHHALPATVWVAISLIYPAFYIGASVYLDISFRRQHRSAQE